MLLAPGAGADRDQPSLVALDQALSARGHVVGRMDFPYRKAGRRAPDRAPVLIEAVRDEAAALLERAGRGTKPGDLILGGRSMGGRMCSMAVAEGLAARALVLISYPLHPPGRPERLRTEHFGAIGVPCLFVSGTRDAFATPDELTEAAALLAGDVTHVWLDGGDHGLRRRDQQVVEAVLGWLDRLDHE
ncbi:MAG: uncharacterized protein QOK43_2081 [Acidimicrobiaceae bacterium]|nr:uncharacterized protein [Acidimicrobiaceae bacterium]